MQIRSQVEAQLEKLSPRDKKLLAGLFSFMVLGALFLFTATLLGLQRSLQADVESADLLLGEARLLQAKYDVADAKLKAQQARLEQYKDKQLSSHVEEIADELGIKDGLKDAQRVEQVDENGVTTTKWRVAVKGRTYDEAVQFILRLENSGYPLRIGNARFKGVTVKREPAVDLNLDVYTYKLMEKS